MSASMGPDYYQVPDMFTVASIQVLMMYYFHCKNSIDEGHDENEYWPRDPHIQWKQTHLFVPADPWYPQSYSSSAESLIKYTIVTIMHFCVIMFIQGIRSSLLFPWAAQHGRNWGFKICTYVCGPSNELLTGCNWLSKALSIQVTNSKNFKVTNMWRPAIPFDIELSKSF